MEKTLLVINPGSTSTKIALYQGETQLWVENITHQAKELGKYSCINEQFQMRLQLILLEMEKHGARVEDLCAVASRGGLLPPVKAGAYEVNQAMIDCLKERPRNQHASNIGAAIAKSIADSAGVKAYVYDPVTVDEMIPLCRVTGMKELKRWSMGHNLNMRAAALKYAGDKGQDYKKLSLIAAHLGGGITLTLHHQGTIIDMISDEEGPFSPERSGGLPIFQLVDMAFSGQYDKASLMKKIQRSSGLVAYFGTSDLRQVEKLIDEGDENAKLVFDAMALNVAKAIAELAATASGEVDAIILTGGMAYSQRLTTAISQRVRFIAPVEVLPGENEMQSLAQGIYRVLNGTEKAREFVETPV